MVLDRRQTYRDPENQYGKSMNVDGRLNPIRLSSRRLSFFWLTALLVAAVLPSILLGVHHVAGQEGSAVTIISIDSFDEETKEWRLEIDPHVGVSVIRGSVIWTVLPPLLDDSCRISIKFDPQNPFTPGTAWQAVLSWSNRSCQVEVSDSAQARTYQYLVAVNCTSWIDQKEAALLITRMEPTEIVTITERATETVTRCYATMTELVLSTTTATKVVPGPYLSTTWVVIALIALVAVACVTVVAGFRPEFFAGKGIPHLRPADLTSVTQRLTRIENSGKARPSLPTLGSVADVEQTLRSITGSVGKVRDVLKRLEAAKDEEEVVETLSELVEQVRNSSDDIGSFTEFLVRRVAGGRDGKELPWFNVLTGNLVEMERALDSATIMVRHHDLGELLFESLARKYAYLTSGAQETERAFALGDIDQISLALNTLMKAKSQLDRELSAVSQGLADWYARLSWKKYLGAAASVV